MKKHKMLITLASLAVAVATTATVAAYTLAGDGSSPPAGESGGTQEPAFQDDKLPSFDPGLDTIDDGKGGVSVTNPKTGGGAIGIPAPGSQGTASDNPPAGKVIPDEGRVVPIDKFDGDVGPTRDPAVHPLPPEPVDAPVAEPDIEEDHEDADNQAVRVGPGTVQLIDPLLATGADVKVTAEVVEQPFFSVGGTIILVDGERVQVLEYSDADALDVEAAQISRDGSTIGTTMVSWVAPPHFFRNETAIVLYVGENPKVIEALTSVLGPQFAGR